MPTNSTPSVWFATVLTLRSDRLNIAAIQRQNEHMATLQVLSKQPATVKEARDVNAVSTVVRVNQVPISNGGAIANMPGPQGTNSPLSSITFNLVNATAGALTYVVGDPWGLVEGAVNPAVPWQKATSLGSGGSVAGVTSTFASSPVSVNGINYIVSNAVQFDNVPIVACRWTGQPVLPAAHQPDRRTAQHAVHRHAPNAALRCRTARLQRVHRPYRGGVCQHNGQHHPAGGRERGLNMNGQGRGGPSAAPFP